MLINLNFTLPAPTPKYTTIRTLLDNLADRLPWYLRKVEPPYLSRRKVFERIVPRKGK